MLVTMAAMERLGMKTGQTTVAVQGFGNVGSTAAVLLAEQGCKVIAVSDISGGVFNKKGIDLQKAIEWVRVNRTLAGFPGGERITQQDLLETECDVLVPAAKEDQITKK